MIAAIKPPDSPNTSDGSRESESVRQERRRQAQLSLMRARLDLSMRYGRYIPAPDQELEQKFYIEEERRLTLTRLSAAHFPLPPTTPLPPLPKFEVPNAARGRQP